METETQKGEATGPRPDFKDHALNREKGMQADAGEGAQNLHTMIWVFILRESSLACQSPNSDAFWDQGGAINKGCGLGQGEEGTSPIWGSHSSA